MIYMVCWNENGELKFKSYKQHKSAMKFAVDLLYTTAQDIEVRDTNGNVEEVR